MSSIEKLEEAKFFLELLDSLNHRVESLTKIEDKAKEASYLFSATLNSFYSVIAIMRDSEGVSVSSFTGNYPEIYARAKNGGERAKTVHVNHTNIAHSGYIPPSANEVNFYFRDLPKLTDPNKNVDNSIDLKFTAINYMFIELKGKPVAVADYCYEHYYKLKAFHANAQKT